MIALGQFHEKRMIDDLRETEFSSHNRENAHKYLPWLLQHIQHLHKIKPDKSPS